MGEMDDSKSLIIFGRDVSRIPCFRNSFLYGISSGLAGGLAHFLFTSNVRTAPRFGVGVFTVVTLGYWIQCRYTYSKTRREIMQMQEYLELRTMYQGTARESEFMMEDKPDSA